MKRISFILLSLLLCVAVNAQQLTPKELCQKAVSATDFSKGLQGQVTLKSKDITRIMNVKTNGTLFRIDKGEDVAFMDGKNLYGYVKKDNTVTIDKDKESALMLTPYVVASKIAGGIIRLTRKPVADAFTVNFGKNGYELACKTEKGVITITIDSKSFVIKNMVFTSNNTVMMTITYSHLSPFKDFDSLKYDKSKYPTAKIIDKRQNNE